jgi:transcriptional regulator with XRE-family HTH domain
MEMKGFSLRQLADKTGVSPAYLSRLFNRERGLPANETIGKFEEVLDIQPRGLLFDAAGRHDHLLAKFFRKDQARPVMRTLASLTEADLDQVQKFVEKILNKPTKARK